MSLDNLEIIKKYDVSNMLWLIESFSEQCRIAKDIGHRFDLPRSFKTAYSSIVCTGLGGSAIGADIARSYVSDEAKSPILVNRNYILPNFVDSKSLVITSSYSGNTEETISAYKDARRRKARIIALTSGGELKKLAEADGYPVVAIPGGLPPRCALGYSFFPLLALLSKAGIVADKSKEIDETVDLLKSLKDEKVGHAVPSDKNPAKKIAKKLYRRFPAIYAAQDHIDCVATRWRGQFAENSKTLSSAHLFPEMNHNEIMGWENPKGLLEYFTAIMLRDSKDHPRVSKRIDVTTKMLKNEGFEIIEVNPFGKSLLARMFSLIYIGDFASFYLAILNRRDPTPVERITYLKKELAKI